MKQRNRSMHSSSVLSFKCATSSPGFTFSETQNGHERWSTNLEKIDITSSGHTPDKVMGVAGRIVTALVLKLSSNIGLACAGHYSTRPYSAPAHPHPLVGDCDGIFQCSKAAWRLVLLSWPSSVAVFHHYKVFCITVY